MWMSLNSSSAAYVFRLEVTYLVMMDDELSKEHIINLFDIFNFREQIMEMDLLRWNLFIGFVQVIRPWICERILIFS